MLAIATPMILEEALSYASTLISLAYAGRLGARALSVFALSHSLTNITGVAPGRRVTAGCSRSTCDEQHSLFRRCPPRAPAMPQALPCSTA